MQTQWKYVGLGVVLGIGMGLVLGGSLWAGLLDPLSTALTADTPTSSMRTLDELNGAWSRTLPCETPETCERFELVMGNAAVLDKETGLVWEQAPDTTTHIWEDNVFGVDSDARRVCLHRGTGGRMGWRLPSIYELMSLRIPDNLVADPDLPIGPGGPPAQSQTPVWPSLRQRRSDQLLVCDDGYRYSHACVAPVQWPSEQPR